MVAVFLMMEQVAAVLGGFGPVEFVPACQAFCGVGG